MTPEAALIELLDRVGVRHGSAPFSDPHDIPLHGLYMRSGESSMPEYANLTAHLVETAQPPEKGQRFIRDSQLSGMALRITAAGAKY